MDAIMARKNPGKSEYGRPPIDEADRLLPRSHTLSSRDVAQLDVWKHAWSLRSESEVIRALIRDRKASDDLMAYQ